MELGIGTPSLSLYRAIKGGDSGLNLSLNDLIDREIKFPSMYELIKSFFTKKHLTLIIKGYPLRLINRLMTIQRKVDEETEKEIDNAKRSTG